MKVILSLGSNLGNRFAYLFQSKKYLKTVSKFIASSSYMETSPIGPSQQKFINQIILVDTELKPKVLLKELKTMEQKIGRKKREHWGPREIDIDILFYEKIILDEQNLIIPHKEVYNRKFVIYGLENLANKLDFDLFEKFKINKSVILELKKPETFKNQKIVML